MTDRFYDSASAGATSPYDTAAKAATTLAAALAAVGASDEIIFVKNTSSEAQDNTYTSSVTYSTPAKPQRLYSVSDFTAGPPVTLAYGAEIKQTASGSDVKIYGNWDIRGIHFNLSTSNGVGSMYLGNSSSPSFIRIIESVLSLDTASLSSCRLGIYGTAYRQQTYIDDFQINFKGTGNLAFLITGGSHLINNLKLGGTATPTTLMYINAIPEVDTDVTIKNSDLSGKSWTNLIDHSTDDKTRIHISVINCKLPASFTPYIGTLSQNSFVRFINSTSGDINYQFAEYQSGGSVITIDSIYATTNPIPVGGVNTSDIFTSLASCGRGNTLSREYFVEVADNTAVTPFVELLVQGSGASALNDNEVYITAEAITVAGTTQGTQVTSHPGALATPSVCSAGTTTYTGDGYATERTHRIETASLTTRQAGWVKITVHLAKASTAIYIGSVGVV